MVRASDSGVRGQGFYPHSGRREQDTVYSPKVLVIPRKGWLRPDMTEKLFTGMLRKKRNETKKTLCYLIH